MNNETIIPTISGIYEHYKGGRYEVIGVGKIEHTDEDVVIYRALYDNAVSQIWVRPIPSFLEEIKVDGKRVPRFRKISDSL